GIRLRIVRVQVRQPARQPHHNDRLLLGIGVPRHGGAGALQLQDARQAQRSESRPARFQKSPPPGRAHPDRATATFAACPHFFSEGLTRIVNGSHTTISAMSRGWAASFASLSFSLVAFIASVAAFILALIAAKDFVICSFFAAEAF